jgi:hypothetical protein
MSGCLNKSATPACAHCCARALMWAVRRPPNRMRSLILIGATLLATGCATTRQSSPAPCSAEARYCDTSDFAAASEEALRSNPGWVEVSCPPLAHHPPVEQVMPQCVELVKAAILLAGANNRFMMERIDISEVQFRSDQDYMDSNVPGREDADLHTFIYAKIPLRWKSERTEPQIGKVQ